MRQRLLWILLAGLARRALSFLAVRHGAGTVGPLSVGDFGSLVYKIVLLVFLGSAVLILFRERLAQALLRCPSVGRPRRWFWWSVTPIASSCATSPTG